MPKDRRTEIPFHPYYTSKDFLGFGVFFMLFSAFVFFAPNYLGHADNYTQANPMITPAHIVPEWYFLPFLRDPAGDRVRYSALVAGPWFARPCRGGRLLVADGNKAR